MDTQETPRPRHRLASIVSELSPAYFAMVMATGIVSMSAQMLGISWLASALFALNIAAYAIIKGGAIIDHMPPRERRLGAVEK